MDICRNALALESEAESGTQGTEPCELPVGHRHTPVVPGDLFPHRVSGCLTSVFLVIMQNGRLDRTGLKHKQRSNELKGFNRILAHKVLAKAV